MGSYKMKKNQRKKSPLKKQKKKKHLMRKKMLPLTSSLTSLEKVVKKIAGKLVTYQKMMSLVTYMAMGRTKKKMS